MNRLFVIGFNGNECSVSGRKALEKAQIVVASSRLLETVSLPESAEKVVLDGAILTLLPALIRRSENEILAFLASGDPLFHGIGGTLMRFVSAEQVQFFPCPTAFQQLFAALGQPWEKAQLFSLHGREGNLPYRAILRANLCAVYGDVKRPARRIAQELIDTYPDSAARKAAAGCNLGSPEEWIFRGTLQEIAQSESASASLSVLALLPDRTTPHPAFPPGLPDDTYAHFKNMITHPEIRAIVLSKLRLDAGVMWDLGAGSGAVGMEAAHLCSELSVIAVEKEETRFQQIQANLLAEGISNVRAIHGGAESLLADLPDPDRIFIGGGGSALLEPGFARLRPGGLLVMTGVMIETIAQMGVFQPEFRQEFLSVHISRSAEIGSGGSLLRAENPIVIAVWRKPVEESAC